jgi:hypothetical protein
MMSRVSVKSNALSQDSEPDLEGSFAGRDCGAEALGLRSIV